MLLRLTLLTGLLLGGSTLFAQDAEEPKDDLTNTATKSLLRALESGDELPPDQDPRANIAGILNAQAGLFDNPPADPKSLNRKNVQNQAVQDFIAADRVYQAVNSPDGDGIVYRLAGTTPGVQASYFCVVGGKLLVCDAKGRTLASLAIRDNGEIRIPEGWSFTGPAPAKNTSTNRRVIGIRTGPLDPALSRHLSLKEGEGILVSGVVSGQPAERAGVRAHDVIVAIDGQRPATLEGLRRTLSSSKKSRVLLTIVRGGKTIQIASGIADISSAPSNLTGLRGGALTLGTDGTSDKPAIFWDRGAAGGFADPRMQIQSIKESTDGTTVTGVIVDPSGRPVEQRVLQLGKGNFIVDPSGQPIGGGIVSGEKRPTLLSGSIAVDPKNSNPPSRGGLSFGGGPMKAKPDDRLETIEKRLERLEALLEKLVEEKSEKRGSPF